MFKRFINSAQHIMSMGIYAQKLYCTLDFFTTCAQN